MAVRPPPGSVRHRCTDHVDQTYLRAALPGRQRRHALSWLHRAFVAGCWFAIGLLIGLAIVNSRADSWDTPDKILGGAALAVTLVDWRQSQSIVKHPDRWRETNRLLGPHPTMGALNRHFIVGIAGSALIAEILPSTGRKAFLGTVTVMEFGYDLHNFHADIRFDFQ